MRVGKRGSVKTINLVTAIVRTYVPKVTNKAPIAYYDYTEWEQFQVYSSHSISALHMCHSLYRVWKNET